MRLPSLLTRTLPAALALTVALPALDGSALAASRVKVAHKTRAGTCAHPLQFSSEQLVSAMINQSLGGGPRDALIIDGVRVPIGDCGPSTVDQYGNVIDNRPTQSGSAWIARMKRRNAGRK